MNQNKWQIPEGMQDTLPGECMRKRAVEQSLRKLFGLHGYQEIETPLLEYYSVMDDVPFGFPESHVFKTFDRRGRTLAMRPDSTLPSVRIAASRLYEEALPLRLCYMQTAATFRLDTASALCEGTQAGVELMGESSPYADAEIIMLAIEALKESGLQTFQIDVGQVAFFQGFMEEAGLDEKASEQLARFVDDKNMLGMALFLKSHKLSEEVTQRLMRLTQLYGDVSILDEAAKMTQNQTCLNAIDNLRQVYHILLAYGLQQYISFDLGMVGSLNYYSGLILRGMTSYLGKPLLSGGRYDKLPASFGRDMPATGFALSVKLLMIALERQGENFKAPRPDMTIGFEANAFSSAVAYATKLRREGKSVSFQYNATRSDVDVYITQADVEIKQGGRF